MLFRRIITAVFGSFVAVLCGWVAGIWVAFLLGAVSLAISSVPGSVGGFGEMPVVVGIASLYFILPVWLLLLVPLYLLIPRSWPVWRWKICATLGAVSGMGIVSLFFTLPDGNGPEDVFGWYLLAAVIGGVTCLVGAITRERFPDFTFPRAALIVLSVLLVTVVTLPAAAFLWLQRAEDRAKPIRVRSDINSYGTLLKEYQTTTGLLPTTEQGLQALVEKPTGSPRPAQWRQLVEGILKDPWNREYIYRSPGTRNPGGYDLFSAGPDRKPDTADDVWGE